jgi:hypothetical protein
MADPELVKTLDYILNRSDEASIEVLAEAVVRRRRDLSIFHASGTMPDPSQMSKDISQQITDGVGGGLDAMRQTVRDMMVRIIKEHAPELNEDQIAELSNAWLPQPGAEDKNQQKLPPDVMASMIEQFISFSHGTIKKSVDENLRKEMGAWPERYWNAFTPVVRGLISDYLKNKITPEEFNSRIGIAVGI